VPAVATCPLCEASCGILVDVEGGHIRSVRGDENDPFSRGYICPKAAALPDLHDDPDRLRAPLVRDGSVWREVSWEEAFDRAAGGLRRVRQAYGHDAVAMYYGNPVAHNLGLMTHALPFARALHTRNIYSASSADQLPQMLVAFRMFGHLGLIPVPDVDRTDLFLIFGANPVASNGSLMTAPNIKRRLRTIRDRGGRVIVVDPRRTETAVAADEHIAIRPGTDALLLASMLHVIVEEGLLRLGRFSGFIKHVDRLTSLVRQFPPEVVARRTGVAADVARRLAREFARTDKAACYSRVGLCTQRDGTIASWLVQVLNVVTGHLDEPGGMMLTTPAVDAVGMLSRLGLDGSYDRWRSRARRLPEFGGDLPVAGLADEIEFDGPGRVRALLTVAGNPVLSAPNGRRLDRVFATLDYVVSIDGYLNETTRHAHVILPPAPPLSRGHYDLALYAFSVRNVAKYSEPVLRPAPSERLDWQIVTELAGRLFIPRPFRALALLAGRRLSPERLLDVLLRIGPHGLSLAKLRQHPHGMDLGPLEPGRFARSIRTPDGLVDAAPEDFVREARTRLMSEIEAPVTGELQLIGRRQLRDNNSWMHNSTRLVKGRPRCTLLVNPLDASARGIESGDLARLASEAGALVVPVEISDTMRPGVVSLPHGWGHDRAGVHLEVASGHAGVNVNDITSDVHLDTLSGNAAFNGLAVTLRRADDPR
jgi:anaerobic selenocysteine-containing dehydrogenase